MNKIIITGRLSKDPVIRYTTGENKTAVASFSIAVDRRIKREGGPDADFFDCTAWGKTAEFMEKYWKKGMKAAISGRLENESWTDKEGNKRISTKIIVDEIEFCEKKEQAPEKKEEWVPTDSLGEELPFKF